MTNRFRLAGAVGRSRSLLATAVALVAAITAGGFSSASDDSIPNNLPVLNPGGHSATFSTEGQVDLTGEYFQAQGSNGRSCVSCHTPEEAWSITPGNLERLFQETGGTHPVFNLLDAD